MPHQHFLAWFNLLHIHQYAVLRTVCVLSSAADMNEKSSQWKNHCNLFKYRFITGGIEFQHAWNMTARGICEPRYDPLVQLFAIKSIFLQNFKVLERVLQTNHQLFFTEQLSCKSTCNIDTWGQCLLLKN